MPQIIDETSARQGTTPHVARYALIFGTAITIIGFGLVWYFVR